MVKETPLTPGKVIDNANIAGEGCYLDDEGTLRSALFGHLIISDDPNDSNDSIANVIPFDSNIYNNNGIKSSDIGGEIVSVSIEKAEGMIIAETISLYHASDRSPPMYREY